MTKLPESRKRLPDEQVAMLRKLFAEQAEKGHTVFHQAHAEELLALADEVIASRSETAEPSGSYAMGWEEALDRAVLAVEGEQAKYIVARSGEAAAGVRGALQYAMDEIRKLRIYRQGEAK